MRTNRLVLLIIWTLVFIPISSYAKPPKWPKDTIIVRNEGAVLYIKSKHYQLIVRKDDLYIEIKTFRRYTRKRSLAVKVENDIIFIQPMKEDYIEGVFYAVNLEGKVVLKELYKDGVRVSFERML